MMEPLKRCLAVAAGIMSVGLAQATTYYVSSGGSDDASGTSRDTPFATIGTAVAAANADETAEAVVLLSDLTSAATVEITGAYTLKGDTADPAATTLSASGTVSPLVKEQGDLLRKAVAACHKYGIKIHAWKVFWRLNMAPQDYVDKAVKEKNERSWK